MSLTRVTMLLVCTLVLAPNRARCDDDDEKKEVSTSHPKAILSYTESEGLRLSPEAVKTLGISTALIMGRDSFQVPGSALVYFQDHVGVYRFQSGTYKRLLVQVVRRVGPNVLVKAEGLATGDLIVIAGAPLLRVAEMQSLFGSGEPD